MEGHLHCLDGNADAEKGRNSLPADDGNFIRSQGFGNNAAAAVPVVDGAAQPASDLQGIRCTAAAEKRNLGPGKDHVSEGFGTGDRTVPGRCRKGRKVVVPWRFQIGYKRKSMAMAGANPSASGVKASSAARNSPSSKVRKATGSVPKKRKTDMNNGHHRTMQQKKKRNKSLVRENLLTTLREFRVIYRKLLIEEAEETTKWREERGHAGLTRPDNLAAFNVYKERLCVEYDDQLRYVGSIPGVQIGDVFNSNLELSVVGLHRAPLSRVDHANNKDDGTCLAVSIVLHVQPSAASHNNNLDILLHVGSTTTAPGDQSIQGTDYLALKQSMDTGTPVRVIHAVVTEPDDHYSRSEQLITRYVYGGLYLVEKLCREKVTGDQCITTFHLKRMARQQRVNIYEVLKRGDPPEPSDGVFMGDISGGLEKMPISAINTISNECPMTFSYISQIQYPSKYQPDPPLGCDCVGGCSLSKKCACAVKNGGMFPFSAMAGLPEDRPLIYECGPSCKCPPTCHNRVSQHGIKFRFQVFKTKSMGWGVRCLDSIPSGSFICEYTGEVIKEQEAQERASDEYLFAAGNNYYDVDRWKCLCKKIPSLQDGPSEDEETVFAVDAINRGNFARFINHSCTPNLFPQNVLYDHDDKSMPHIMFFASEDIPALEELSYDYNYVVDEVYDSGGNKKKKQCLCGSVECTGWLY